MVSAYGTEQWNGVDGSAHRGSPTAHSEEDHAVLHVWQGMLYACNIKTVQHTCTEMLRQNLCLNCGSNSSSRGSRKECLQERRKTPSASSFLVIGQTLRGNILHGGQTNYVWSF